MSVNLIQIVMKELNVTLKQNFVKQQVPNALLQEHAHKGIIVT